MNETRIGQYWPPSIMQVHVFRELFVSNHHFYRNICFKIMSSPNVHTTWDQVANNEMGSEP